MTKKKIKILMTTSTLPRWENDTELRVVLDIAKSIDNNLAQIYILAPHYQGAKTNEILENIEIIRFKYFFSGLEKLCYTHGILGNLKKNKLLFFLLPCFAISQILKTKKIVKEHQIQIIHAHWILPQGLLAVIYKKLFHKNIKIVSTLHGSDAYLLKNTNYFFKNFILKNTDHLTAVSKSLLNIYKNNKTKLSHIPNGINTSKYQKQNTPVTIYEKFQINFPYLLFIGRLTEIKGLDFLLQAMPTINSKFPKLKLVIAGDGPEKKDLVELVTKLKIKKQVIFLGKVSNKETNQLYSYASIFIAPSILVKGQAEGFGMVILEALACEVPVIATNTGGIKEIISHRKNGLLVEEKNSEALSDAVLELLKNGNLRDRFRKKGRELVLNNYSWKTISQKYLSIYNELSEYE